MRIQVQANDKILEKKKKKIKNFTLARKNTNFIKKIELPYNRAISKQRCENPNTSKRQSIEKKSKELYSCEEEFK